MRDGGEWKSQCRELRIDRTYDDGNNSDMTPRRGSDRGRPIMLFKALMWSVDEVGSW